MDLYFENSTVRLHVLYILVEGHFLRIQVEGKKAQQQGQQRFGKEVAKPSGPSSRNNGSQVHEINKWVLRR